MTTAAPQTEPTPEAPPADLDTETILAVPSGPVNLTWQVLNEETWEYDTLSFQVVIRRLQTIQTMKLLKIVTSGVGRNVDDFDWDPDDVAGSIGGLITTVLFAIPDAVRETTDFVRSMVELVPDKSGFQPGNNKHAQAANDENVKAQRAIFDLAFQNPDLDALVLILERVMVVEGPHLAALGKRLVDLYQNRPTRS